MCACLRAQSSIHHYPVSSPYKRRRKFILQRRAKLKEKYQKEQINAFHQLSTAHKTNPRNIDFRVSPWKRDGKANKQCTNVFLNSQRNRNRNVNTYSCEGSMYRKSFSTCTAPPRDQAAPTVTIISASAIVVTLSDRHVQQDAVRLRLPRLVLITSPTHDWNLQLFIRQ